MFTHQTNGENEARLSDVNICLRYFSMKNDSAIDAEIVNHQQSISNRTVIDSKTRITY